MNTFPHEVTDMTPFEVSLGTQPSPMARTAYYAHCLSIYNTPQEERDIALIWELGFMPVNPNTPETQARCDALRAVVGAATEELPPEKKDIMNEIFKPMVLACDILVFRALPDGSISSGAVKEIRWAQEVHKPVIELPSQIQRRSLSLAETREYLREAGQR